MKKSKSTISKATSYKEIGDFWDNHDLSDYWERGKDIGFDVNLESEITYYALDKRLSDQIQPIARRQGVSPDTLINLWIQEKLKEQNV